eukprot:SAG11_NODE_10000_length_863_cov_1.535340_1_plen_22_part_10
MTSSANGGGNEIASSIAYGLGS